MRSKETRVSIVEPIHIDESVHDSAVCFIDIYSRSSRYFFREKSNQHRKQRMMSFQVNPLVLSPFIIASFSFSVDDFSNGYQYESHLGRLCRNVIVVSARHPHSFFLQTLDDLTYCDNFFSKMK